MGKISQAKKKERRKDFQKVKFKVGKTLPKNTNETRATFKAKTLVLKQQFKTDKEGPVSHRNLTWKELLAHLGHYNQSIKLDAIHSLKEMITTNQDIIQLDLNNFLENICPLFSDRDYKVREACMQLFKTFLQLPAMTRRRGHRCPLEPFYSLFNVHLSCAMTNVCENVQYDSLKLLDILVDQLPDLVRTNAYTIFENFINQISKATSRGEKRTLKNDPYKMTSTQTWRSKVLSRLLKMLQIVSATVTSSLPSTDNKTRASENLESVPEKKALEWTSDNLMRSKSILVNIDMNANRQCSITSYVNDTEELKTSLRICKRLSVKRNLTEVREFFEHYFKVITPLLADCWIEAKPENKNIIESYESLSIMHSVLSILNLLLENLQFKFSDLGKQIRPSDNKQNRSQINLLQHQIKYIEQLFLGQFPYSLAENFEYTVADSKKTPANTKLKANTINLLLCKLCSSSLLQLTEQRLLGIFKYSLDSLVVTNKAHQNAENNENSQHKLELNELVTLLNLAETILSSFTNIDITKPFLIALTKYFDAATKFSQHKWLVFEFLCKEFYENNKIKECDNIFISFYKKIFPLCIAYAKEKKERLELLIDRLRNLIIKKEKTQPSILSMLEEEYVNMLNALDFESKQVTEACKKKLLELIYWLPKINRFLFTKLSILILKKNLSIVNTNQILGILKTRLDNGTSINNNNESKDASFDQSDYLMFLTSLFNGSNGFDLMNNTPSSDFYTLDCEKFMKHEQLCQHLEEFVSSDRNSDVLIDVLLSSSVPIFTNLSSVTCRTLYGSLCLMSQLSSLEAVPEVRQNLVNWLTNALFWLLNRLQTVQVNQLGTREQVEQEISCLNLTLFKVDQIYKKNTKFLGDCMLQLYSQLKMSNNLDYIRKMFVVINYLLANFGPGIKSASRDTLCNIYQSYQSSFDESSYVWWHEYCNLVKAL